MVDRSFLPQVVWSSLAKLTPLAITGGCSVFFTGRPLTGQLMSVMRAGSTTVVIYSNRDVNHLFWTPDKIHEYVRAGLAVVASNQRRWCKCSVYT